MAKDDRLKVPIDAPYLHALGLATICFVRLEWSAVWCSEKLQAGYANTTRSKTAGQIARDLVDLAGSHPDPNIVASLGDAANEFLRLVGRRNDLVHARPGTNKTKEQRVFRDGAEWTIADVEALADDFAAAARVLNHHFHEVLK